MRKAFLLTFLTYALLGPLATSEIRAPANPSEPLACTEDSQARVSLASIPCTSLEDVCLTQAQPQEQPENIFLTRQPQISTTTIAQTSLSFQIPIALPDFAPREKRGGALVFLPTVVLRV